MVGLVVLEGRTELEAAVFFKIPLTFGAVDDAADEVARVLPEEVRVVLAAGRELVTLLPTSVVLVDPVSLEVDALTAVDRVVEGTRGFTVTVDVALIAVVGFPVGRVVDNDGFVAATVVLVVGVVNGFVDEMTGLVFEATAADTGVAFWVVDVAVTFGFAEMTEGAVLKGILAVVVFFTSLFAVIPFLEAVEAATGDDAAERVDFFSASVISCFKSTGFPCEVDTFSVTDVFSSET